MIDKLKLKSFGKVLAALDDPDMTRIEFILVSSGANLNGHYFPVEELKKAVNTPIGKPIKAYFDDWDGDGLGYPIGHMDRVIGVILDSKIVETENGVDIVCVAGIWKSTFPLDDENIKFLFERGELFFSMECEPKKMVNTENGIELYGIIFIGAAVVANPANPRSKALLVASLQGGKNMGGLTEIEEFKKVLAEKDEKIVELTALVEDLETKLEASKSELVNANDKLEQINAQVEAAKAKARAEKRFTEMSEYIQYTDEEKETVMAELEKLDDAAFESMKAIAERAFTAKHKQTETEADKIFASLTDATNEFGVEVLGKYLEQMEI